MSRTPWTDLPDAVRAAIIAECGAVRRVDHPDAGSQSDFTATLHTDAEPVFCKGIRTTTPRAAMHRHEAAINPHLPAAAPRLRWMVEVSGWLVLGFEHVQGGHADLSPGSPDVGAVARAVAGLAVPAPPIAPSLAGQWSRLAAWRRLRVHQRVPDHFVAWESRAFDLVDGDTLLHTDIHALNLLVDGNIRVVDWAWARRGASWVDRAFLVLRLIEAGHAPAEAERLAGPLPGPGATAFAVAVLGIWTHLRHTDPRPHGPALVAAARDWSEYRLGLWS
ncbi:hypothetical protein [Alloactinosynnema sp. L-07]|uniref:phosphotransferase n=1 Tax=Alloactinosynnema sp. L-07 TaxID=1653480 RepID=UPI00065EF614|nr:phosphotransferase [Alloactinosynnema sp. L-07]CRK55023.1 hypothetical protein [Alloactinosynnema sp. L-07]